MTRAPRSMESSRWKTRCGVYFRTHALARARSAESRGALPVSPCTACLAFLAEDADEDMRVFQVGVTSTWFTVTSAPSKVSSRVMIVLSSRLSEFVHA